MSLKDLLEKKNIGVKKESEKKAKKDVFVEDTKDIETEEVKKAETKGVEKVKPKKKEEKVMKKETKGVEKAGTDITVVEFSTPVSQLTIGSNLPMIGSEELIREVLSEGFIPRRFISLSKDLGKFTTKSGEEKKVIEEPRFFIFGSHVWRQNSDSELNTICVSPDGETGVVYGKCAKCPAKTQCKKCITYFMSDGEYEGVYMFTIRDGFAMASKSEIIKVGWYDLYSEKKKHKGYTFYIPHFNYDFTNTNEPENLQFLLNVVNEHLKMFSANPMGPRENIE